jgi:hypothetical protein
LALLALALAWTLALALVLPSLASLPASAVTLGQQTSFRVSS